MESVLGPDTADAELGTHGNVDPPKKGGAKRGRDGDAESGAECGTEKRASARRPGPRGSTGEK